MGANRVAEFFRFDDAAERGSADNPQSALGPDQRRAGGPLLALAFGWGFLITGLLTGGALGAGLPLWPDLLWYSLLGNLVNFAIGALVGYIAFKTGCNSALLFRAVYGRAGAYLPVLFIAMLTIGWQGIVVGAFAQVWTQAPGTALYYAVAIFAGLLYTGTTLFGVKGLERVGLPSMIILVLVGLYAIWINIGKAGGVGPLLQVSQTVAAKNPITGIQAINLVIGSWIVGAVVMSEYVRFSRSAVIAMAIPFVVLVLDQTFLHVVGSLGAIVSGTADFTTYMRSLGGFAAIFALVGMTLALWTTGDTNLYLPSVQTASLLRRPKRVMVLICGLAGTVLGLGIYERFLDWIGLLATIVPPVIGPVLADYYLLGRHRRGAYDAVPAHTLSVAAVLGFVGGAWLAAKPQLLTGLLGNVEIAPALLGLAASIIIYVIVRPIETTLAGRRAPDRPSTAG
ncbi:MAG: cytosine permease [Steroidobacteraceae bacterium]|nr:cytosine permease [Steroidobacteraceae bacterium]